MGIVILFGVFLFWGGLLALALWLFARSYKRRNLAIEPLSKCIPLAALASMSGPGVLVTHALTPIPLAIGLLFHLGSPFSWPMLVNLAAFLTTFSACISFAVFIRKSRGGSNPTVKRDAP